MRILILGILILMPFTDACAGWKVLAWHPFQVKEELKIQYHETPIPKYDRIAGPKSKLLRKSGKESDGDVQQTPADVQGLNPSELQARVRDGYLRPADLFPGAYLDELQSETEYRSDLFKNIMMRRGLSAAHINKTDETIGQEDHVPLIRLSFFSRDMRHLNRDAPQRDTGGFDALEALLFPGVGTPRQPLLETMGRIFEPKVDLSIEF